jgi:transposase
MTDYRKSFPVGTNDLVLKVIKESSDQNVLRRAQAIYCRSAHDMSLEKIAELTGFAVSTVRRLHSDFLRKGIEIFNLPGRGGRRNQIMTLSEEEVFLNNFIEAGDKGGILEVSAIHRALCIRAGRNVHLSATYKLLHRHGWRKIMPRPRHPKADKYAQADFKKMA